MCTLQSLPNSIRRSAGNTVFQVNAFFVRSLRCYLNHRAEKKPLQRKTYCPLASVTSGLSATSSNNRKQGV